MQSIEVTRRSGARGLRIAIDARITPEEDLVLECQDLGELVSEFWGDEDYEYWVAVPAEQKDEVLLRLLAEKYRGDNSAVSNFRKWLEKHDIEHSFDSWV